MSKAEKKYTITFLKKDLHRIYNESGMVSDKSDSTIRTALAQYLVDSGFNSVNVKPETLQDLKEKYVEEIKMASHGETGMIRKEVAIQELKDLIKELQDEAN